MGEARRRRLAGVDAFSRKETPLRDARHLKSGVPLSRAGREPANIHALVHQIVGGLQEGRGILIPTSQGLERCLDIMDAVLQEAGNRGINLMPCDILPVIRPINAPDKIFCVALPPWAKTSDEAIQHARVVLVSENSHVLEGHDASGQPFLRNLAYKEAPDEEQPTQGPT